MKRYGKGAGRPKDCVRIKDWLQKRDEDRALKAAAAAAVEVNDDTETDS